MIRKTEINVIIGNKVVIEDEGCDYLVGHYVDKGHKVFDYVCKTREEAWECFEKLENLPLRSMSDFSSYFIMLIRRYEGEK